MEWFHSYFFLDGEVLVRAVLLEGWSGSIYCLVGGMRSNGMTDYFYSVSLRLWVPYVSHPPNVFFPAAFSIRLSPTGEASRYPYPKWVLNSQKMPSNRVGKGETHFASRGRG